MRDLLGWMESPSAVRGLRFLQDGGTWETFSYEQLAFNSRRTAMQLRESGVQSGQVVCVFLPTGPELFRSIFGTWIAGGTICPLVPPILFEDESEYADHIAGILKTARPSVVVTNPTLEGLVALALDRSGGGRRTQIVQLSEGDSACLNPQLASDLALLQYTSGSSGTPRGVKVSFDNLAANIDAISKWVRISPEDATATWLPLYHDMGLIGCLLTPTLNDSDVWIMRPDQFVRQPIEWLRCFGERGATLCASPNFGYGYAAAKVKPEQVDGFDFSRWRVAIAGAEPVDAAALESFLRLVGPKGFRPEAFLPAYGLAEATLAVTGSSQDRVPRAARLDWDGLSFGSSISILEQSQLGDIGPSAESGWLVGSGAPHPDMAVTIVGESGEQLPEETLGEIVVSGPSVAEGYYGPVTEGATRFREDGLWTGDAGFVSDGELYVVGRIADSIKIRGKSIYAEDLEVRVAAETGIRRARCAVVVIPGRRGGSILVLGESVDPTWVHRAGSVVRSAVGDQAQVRVAIGPQGIIRRTSSGKPRRRLMWDLHARSELGGSESVAV